MCTTICAELNGKFLFGRNLDLEYDFGNGIAVMPRNYPIKLRCGDILLRHPLIAGVAIVKDGYPLFAEGMNEYGLCIAGLKFPDSDEHSKVVKGGRVNITPFEIIPYLLASCKSISEARERLSACNVIDIPFDDDTPNSPMHYHIADSTGSIVLEAYGGELNVYDNEVGVLTNSPPFPYHLYNLALYLNLERGMPQDSGGAKIFGGGLMAHGLPGDYSSPSRFVKAAWLRSCIECPTGAEEAVLLSYLRAVAPPYHSVLAEADMEHFTRYSSIMDAKDGRYSLYRFGAAKPLSVDIKKESPDSDSLLLYS